MPYLALRTNKTLTLSQEVELKTTVGKLITVFPGESVDTFMIHIEDNQLIYFKGQEANCMMITLYLKVIMQMNRNNSLSLNLLKL